MYQRFQDNFSGENIWQKTIAPYFQSKSWFNHEGYLPYACDRFDIIQLRIQFSQFLS